jgi:hypothetical protein
MQLGKSYIVPTIKQTFVFSHTCACGRRRVYGLNKAVRIGRSLRQHSVSSTMTRRRGSERRLACGSQVYLSISTLFLVLSASIVSLPLVAENDGGLKLSSQSMDSTKCYETKASDVTPYAINITVDCDQTQGVIPTLFVGHYDVDPTRTGIGLNDTVGTRLMKDVDLGFWRVSIGRWEMMDFPSNEDIEQREYFRGSTFEDASNASMYCWEHMDKVFNSVSQFNCIPLICIDYMPRTLANNTEEMPLPRLYTYPNNVRNSPPKNTTVFAEVIKHVVMHYTQGWPSGTGHYYDFEYWEVWNEPELAMFWNGTLHTLFQLYGKISKSIKSIDTSGNPLNYRVGGLSFAVPGTQGVAWNITDFLSYCKTNSLPLDFLSWHGYPYDYNNLIKAAQISHNELLKFGFENALNILAEWGIPLGIGEQYWGSSYYAAFTSLILSDLTRSNLVDYQTHTCMKDRDVVNSSGGYWGILHREPTTPKPVYNVFKAFDMLNETNNGLNCTLTSLPKSFGQAAIVGRSDDNMTLTLIYTNSNNTGKSVRIDFLHLPWKTGLALNYTHYLIDNETSLTPIEITQLDSSKKAEEFSATFTAGPYTVHIIRITLVKQPDLTPVLVLLVVATAACTLLITGILIRRKRTRQVRR